MMTEKKLTEQTIKIAGRVLKSSLIEELNLANPPERLNDKQLAQADAMASAPLPDLPACDSVHLAKCLRMMMAVLPRQNIDEIGGKLFVAVYERHLGKHPASAIDHLTDRAVSECR